METHGHAIQVYETDRFLQERVVDYLAAGLTAKDSCIVIATPANCEAFREGLLRRGCDVASAIASRRLVMLDALDTLDRFMVSDVPDRERFELVLGTAITELRRSGADTGRVRAFGEMVNVLWQSGRPHAAIYLEALWNELARRHDFDLLCAYALGGFGDANAAELREVCALHDHVHAPEPRTNGASSAEHAHALVHEIAQRGNVERELRDALRALEQTREVERARTARTLQLQEATAQLATAVNTGEVADAIVSTTARLTGATATTVHLADGEFRLFGAHELAAAEAALGGGRARWIEHRGQLVGELPALADRMPGTHAVVVLPLIASGRLLGGIGLAFETRRTFSDEERRWLASFATQCAVALERAQLYAGEHKARRDAETLLRIAEALHDMGLDLDAILQRVSDEATALVGAEYGAFLYDVKNDRGAYVIYAATGARKDALSRFGVARNTPLFSVGPAAIRVDDVRGDERYAQMPWCDEAPTCHQPIASFLAIPVRDRTGKVIGGLFFGHREPARFTAQHEQILRTLAVTAAIAVDNAELYRTARDAEDSQRKTVAQLVETIHMNELFTGVLAHDLRSPLAAITTANEVLQLKSQGLEKRMAERAVTSARRMARMIEQLLDFTRIRIGTGLPVEPKDCELDAVVSHVVDELRATHPNQPLRVTTTGALRGRWDDDRLAQAVSNLIGNAALHGRPERGVDIAVDGTDPSTVRIEITNAGTIPDEVLSRPFEPLLGGQRRRDGSRGLGLGLFITREIAASHGGSIGVMSADDRTTFTLVLPREVEPRTVEPRAPEPAKRPPAPAYDNGQRMRMLVESVRDCGIFMLDAGTRITSWPAAAERITGWSREAIANQSIDVLYPEHSLLEVELGRAAKLGVSEHEGWYKRRDGTRFWGHVALSAIHAPSGELVGYAAVVRDRSTYRASLQALEESESLQRLMMDCVRDYAIFTLDNDGHVRTWSRGAQLIKGYTQGEILGKHIATFYTREDREAGRPQMLLGRALADGRVEDEGWRVRKDGSRFWADVVITALRDEAGELRGFAKVTRDLTERRRSEEELRRSEERFRLMVDTVRDYAIFLLDAGGHVMTWNTGAERTKGYAAHEILGQHFSKFYDPEEVRAGKCDRELEIAAREGRFEEEGWRLRKDGSRFWASVVISTLHGPGREVVGYVKVTRDLTERRRLEEERMRSIQAQEGIRLRDEFLSIVSHELKTPLTGLLLQLDALVRRAGDRGLREALVRAREGGERLDNLIETLLEVSRIATGRFVITPERFDLVVAAREITDSFQPAATRMGCELRLHAPRSVDGMWDRVRIEQVITNLLSNAIKYGAGHPIDVTVGQRGDRAVIEVRDHGPGVDPTLRQRIFDRFERAVSSRHYGGLGLGLYVVREIVSGHGGRVRVEDSPDGGARFIIELPMETT